MNRSPEGNNFCLAKRCFWSSKAKRESDMASGGARKNISAIREHPFALQQKKYRHYGDGKNIGLLGDVGGSSLRSRDPRPSPNVGRGTQRDTPAFVPLRSGPLDSSLPFAATCTSNPHSPIFANLKHVVCNNSTDVWP
ncbi:hypothetical protein CBM2589_U10040 [Cupriavidus taiwanensis]|uniref:Uncharacterized protein n=1 Tax=Cupriavidus taiwanensis TaxID=164546 RepID=A0A375CQF2_9BURK|nr:hypothetical protein CBM2589_U10040 [Cupriavidus taiwanensis]